MPRPSPPSPRPLPPSAPASPPPAPSTSELQLAIARTGIGLELTSPLTLGCLRVMELTASLPGLRFPLDVSGGVSRFRNRRGIVERVVIEVPRPALEQWAAPRLRGLLGVATPKVMLFVRRSGVTVGVVSAEDGRALAFEVELDTTGDDLGLSVHDARGIGLQGPATPLAVRALHAVAGDAADREGARFAFPRVVSRLTRLVFPERGARAPDAGGLVWSAARGHDDAWLLVAQRGENPQEPASPSVVARESCALARLADDAAFALDLEKARGLLVEALERAPRHRELSRRLAEIDHALGARAAGRAEAALATLRDASAADGLLSAELLREVLDVTGAVAAFTQAGEAEPVGPLAALAYDAAARLTSDEHDALELLDRAIARAPALPGPRWTRLATRLAVGRIADARADAEHLDALASGARARHAVWMRAGLTFRAEGRLADAAELFERALRYGPRDASATAGLGAALLSAGKLARGTALLREAITLADAERVQAWGMHVDLANALAEQLGDKPAAIARVRTIPAHAAEALVARGLEGRWRSALGDLAGASVAFARARELAETRLAELTDASRKESLAVLLEAARFERDAKGDWLAAQRHLGCAVRLAPHDPAAASEFREAGRKVAGVAELAHATDAPPPPESEMTFSGDGDALREMLGAAPDEAEDHARVEALTRKLHADPTDDRVIDELATRLLRLGRTHELYALLSSRFEGADEGRRAALLPTLREALTRLEADAKAAGREDEAALFRETREGLG